MSHLLLAAVAVVALVPRAALAQSGRAVAWAPGESGFVVGADVGAGSAIGTGTRYTRSGRLELELSGGYDFPRGIRPEVAIALGMAPSGHVAIRPGLHVSVPDTPFYVRGAVDWSNLGGSGRWRWILGGAGGELRLTGMLGGFAEVDLGIPVVSDAGVELLFRAGISLRL